MIVGVKLPKNVSIFSLLDGHPCAFWPGFGSAPVYRAFPHYMKLMNMLMPVKQNSLTRLRVLLVLNARSVGHWSAHTPQFA